MQRGIDADRSGSPLAGIRILAFTQFLLGPAGVQYLADLGADVIKVESPGSGAWERTWAGQQAFVGDQSVFFLAFNRNQRSLTLDLKHPDSKELVDRLLGSADVVIQNFRPGVMERFGLGYEDLRERYPGLIYVSASGYGESGPYRDRPGQDLLLQAISGLCSVTGRADEPPTPAGAAIVDQHGAALLAMGTLAALLSRDRTGRGRKVEVSMLRAALDLQQEPIAYHLNGFPVSRATSALGSGFHPAPYGIYRTSDGAIAISLSPIATLRRTLGLEALTAFEDPNDAFTKREQISRVLEDHFQDQPTDEWIEVLSDGGIWCAPVHDYDAVFQDPQVRHLQPVAKIPLPPAGTLELLRFPIDVAGNDPRAGPPPTLGQHTAEILSELGFGEDDIKRFRATRVV